MTFFSEIQRRERIILVVLYFSITINVGWRFQASKGIQRHHKNIVNMLYISSLLIDLCEEQTKI